MAGKEDEYDYLFKGESRCARRPLPGPALSVEFRPKTNNSSPDRPPAARPRPSLRSPRGGNHSAAVPSERVEAIAIPVQDAASAGAFVAPVSAGETTAFCGSGSELFFFDRARTKIEKRKNRRVSVRFLGTATLNVSPFLYYILKWSAIAKVGASVRKAATCVR